MYSIKLHQAGHREALAYYLDYRRGSKSPQRQDPVQGLSVRAPLLGPSPPRVCSSGTRGESVGASSSGSGAGGRLGDKLESPGEPRRRS